MSWLQVQIDLGDVHPEPVEQALLALGAASIEFRDAGNEPILEAEPGTTPLWEKIRVAALFDEDISETTVLLAIAGSVAPAPMPQVRISLIHEQDWVTNWKQSLRPQRFGANLWVCPPDAPCPDELGISVTMEPGMAFGTGSHPTTALCLTWLSKQPVAEKSMLDYGCGSGILSIASLALGAAQVTAVDIDEQALLATRDNARCNPGEDRLRVSSADLMDPAMTFDMIIANILSGTVIDLAPTLRSHSRPGTRIALSGILTTRATEVSNAYGRWLDFDPPETREEWALLCGTVA